MQAKIGIIWSFSQIYYQLPEIPLVQPKIGIIWSFSQNNYQPSNVMVPWPLSGLFHKWEKYGDGQTDTQVPPVDLLDAGKNRGSMPVLPRGLSD